MDVDFMREAICEAERALQLDEVPVGAVIVKDDVIIARAHNLRETLKDPTAHAELLAIKQACDVLQNWRLSGCRLYVTLEPCPMCAGTIIQSRISKVFIGTFDSVAGACGSVINMVQNRYLNTMVDVNWVYNEECSELLTRFFQKRR